MFLNDKSVLFIEDESLSDQSLIGFAQVLYALNNLQSCAYINFSIKSHEPLSLLEQLFLRTSLAKEYPFIHIDYFLRYSDSKKDIITRGILSQVEFQNVHISTLLPLFEKQSYQTLIVDNVTKDNPHLDVILKLVQLSIWKQVLIIGSKDIKHYFKQNVTHEYKLSSNVLTNAISHTRLSSINTIVGPYISSNWIIIAYNFTLLKYQFSKRFFFLSYKNNFAKEILFISLLKKHVKNLQEFGNWDYIFLSGQLQTPTKENKELDAFNQLLVQSFKLKGLSNILFPYGLLEKLELSLINHLYELLQKQKSLSVLITNKNVEEILSRKEMGIKHSYNTLLEIKE